MAIEDGGVVETATKTIPILLQTVDLVMYPEGGELVAGLPNRVYLEAKTPAKKPADIAGAVVDRRGNVVANFRTEHEGRGRFTFVPKADEKYKLEIDEPAFVYDVRAGRPVGAERIAAWEVALSRGRPQLFALLPYRVTALDAEAPEEARLGEAVPLHVAVSVEPGKAAYHVVHVDVFAPGSEKPHRQYSQNIDCPGGEGQATIPLALNDPEGLWRLEFKDAATGARTVREVRVSGRPAGA